MKVRSAWPSAFLVVFLGCGSGSIGSPDNAGNGNGNGGSSSGDVGAGGSGNGGTSGSSAVVAGTPVDGGVITADGSFVAYSPTPPASEGAVVGEVITKLTAVEYANTVNDLLGIPPIQQTVPLSADSTAGGFSIGGASTDDTAQAYHDSAIVIATVATSATGMPNLLKAANCAAPAANSGSAGAACAAAFINEFAPLAFRHGAVDAATIAGLNGVYTAVAVTDAAGFSGGMAAVLEEILQSPYKKKNKDKS